MTLDEKLTAIRDLVQQDVGNRGLARDPHDNLLTACPNDFANACRSIAASDSPRLAVVTGFFIPTADPPAGETDGPLGAVFVARACAELGIEVAIVTDPFCRTAIEAGLDACSLSRTVRVVDAPTANPGPHNTRLAPVSHVIALERVGPSHTSDSLVRQGVAGEEFKQFMYEVPPEHRDRCHTMRGRDITDLMRPAHLLFEFDAPHATITLTPSTAPTYETIGIGDGGNEIGMGKVRWDTIRRNIPNGGLVACRVPCDHLIVAGVSNWGAYALAAGVALVSGRRLDPRLFDPRLEREILESMVAAGPLVDGVTGQPTATVDGLAFDEYVRPLEQLRRYVAR